MTEDKTDYLALAKTMLERSHNREDFLCVIADALIDLAQSARLERVEMAELANLAISSSNAYNTYLQERIKQLEAQLGEKQNGQ